MTMQSAPQPDQDPRWTAVQSRDAGQDGQFYYSVRTTGVYCRPSCAARRPRRENVAFHASRTDAELAGFRPCKRCKPDQSAPREQQTALIEAACRLIERSEPQPTLAELADAAGLSAFHFHRLFKAITGVTPKGYAQTYRANRVRAELRKPESSVTAALYDAGFQSSGPFYAGAAATLGMTPTQYRAGGTDAELHFALGQCSLGAILVASSAKGIAAILLGDDPEALLHDLQDRFPRAALIGDDPAYAQTMAQVIGFIDRPVGRFSLPLDVRGTAFQHRVWQALRDIPPGETISYGALAERLGQPGAARAVAGACAANPAAIAIPCHRVVRNDGALSGYRWGIERKRELLRREGSILHDAR